MADIADIANENLEAFMITSTKSRIPEKPVYYKFCRNCQEPTPDGLFL